MKNKKPIHDIASYITDDPDIFNEGWLEDMGIEDPNLTSKTPHSRIHDIINQLNEFFNVNYGDVGIGVLGPKAKSYREKWMFDPKNLPEDYNGQLDFYLVKGLELDPSFWEKNGDAIYSKFKQIVESNGWNASKPFEADYQTFLTILPPNQTWESTGIQIDDWSFKVMSDSSAVMKMNDSNNDYVLFTVIGTKNGVKFHQEIIFNNANISDSEYTTSSVLSLQEIRDIFVDLIEDNYAAKEDFQNAIQQAFPE